MWKVLRTLVWMILRIWSSNPAWGMLVVSLFAGSDLTECDRLQRPCYSYRRDEWTIWHGLDYYADWTSSWKPFAMGFSISKDKEDREFMWPPRTTWAVPVDWIYSQSPQWVCRGQHGRNQSKMLFAYYSWDNYSTRKWSVKCGRTISSKIDDYEVYRLMTCIMMIMTIKMRNKVVPKSIFELAAKKLPCGVPIHINPLDGA